MLLFLLSTIITHLAAFLYPAYLSYKALKARDARALVHCLQYWAVLGIFSCCELITDTFLFWLPFYYELKLVFVLWLILPFTNGATVIYRTLLHPTLERHEKDIDVALQQVQISAKQTSTEWGRRGFHAIQKVAVDSIAASLGSTRVEPHLSVLSSGGEQVGSLLSSAANALTIPSPRIREILSSDEEETTSQREGGTSLLLGILPALALGATSLRGDHVPASNEGSHLTSEASREEQYIQSQRAALYKMMDQLDKAEAEVKLNRHHNLRKAAPAPSKKSNLPSIPAIGISASSSVDPLAGPSLIHRRRSRRHVLGDVESKSHQPHPPRTTRLPHRQKKTKGEHSSNTAETSPATNGPSSSTAISDFDGLVFIGEDLSFTDRELDELGVPAREKPNVPPASSAPSSGHPGSTSQSWFPSLW